MKTRIISFVTIVFLGVFLLMLTACPEETTTRPVNNSSSSDTTGDSSDSSDSTSEDGSSSSEDSSDSSESSSSNGVDISLNYTTINYNFDGTIDEVVAKIEADSTGGDSGNGSDVTFDVVIEGIVTSIGVNHENNFVFQDQNAGIFVYGSTAASGLVSVGDRITMHVTNGKEYYNLIEITAFDSLNVISSGNTIYAQEITGAVDDTIINKYVIMRNISIASSGSYGVFQINSADNPSIHFQTGSTFEDQIKGQSGVTIAGPITYSFDKYRIETITNDEWAK